MTDGTPRSIRIKYIKYKNHNTYSLNFKYGGTFSVTHQNFKQRVIKRKLHSGNVF
jgi:hypothetical protein